MIASMVPLHYLNDYWPTVAPMLQRAVDRQNKYGLDDVYLWLINQDATLWIVEDEESKNEVVGTVVSRIVQYSKQRVLFLDFLGGKKGAGGTLNKPKWKDAMLDILRRWADDNSCETIEFVGRSAWGEVFKENGCVVKNYVYEMPITAWEI